VPGQLGELQEVKRRWRHMLAEDRLDAGASLRSTRAAPMVTLENV
jgi:hypothetical protein